MKATLNIKFSIIPFLLLIVALSPSPASAQFYKPFFVWNEDGYPIRNELGVLLAGENPANPDWSDQTGDLVQVIYVGIDGIISPPDINGNPTGDDTVFASTQIGWGTPWSWVDSGRFCTNIDRPPPKNCYVRAFNAPTLPGSSFYGDSTIFLTSSSDSFPINRYGLLATDKYLDDGDDDGDGLNNSWEKSLSTDPENPDSDGDGLLDGEEKEGHTLPANRAALGYPDVGEITFNVAGTYNPVTEPKVIDTDGDTYSDFIEVVELGSDPRDPDSPGDDNPTPTPTATPTAKPTATPTPKPPVTTPIVITPTPSPSSTPTLGYCNEALQIADLDNLWLAQTRAGYSSGWRYEITRATNPDIDAYGYIDDNSAMFVEQTEYILQPVAMHISRVNENINIQEGDYLKVTFTNGTEAREVNVYPPALIGNIDTYYFIGRDGSTYSDRWLCELAKGVPTQTPTPTPIPTFTPVLTPTQTPTTTPSPITTPKPIVTATPSVTPSVTPTPSPQPTSYYLVLDGNDFNGDGTSEIAIYRRGLWAIRDLTRSYYGAAESDQPVPGDYDGDGTSDIGIFRGSSGLWAIRLVTRVYYGTPGDMAVSADYCGNGISDIAIYRPSCGLWAVRGINRTYFGASGDTPIPADFDGDGTTDRGIYRQRNGLWAIRSISRIYFGRDGDNAMPVDYDGDDTADIGIFRQDDGLWAFRHITRCYFGRAYDIPVSADYTGAEMDEIGIFRPSSGLWAIRGVTRAYFGTDGDIPLSK